MNEINSSFDAQTTHAELSCSLLQPLIEVFTEVLKVHPNITYNLGKGGLEIAKNSSAAQKAFYEHLHPYDLVKYLEDPNISELLTKESVLTEKSILTALSVYPDLPRSLGPNGKVSH